MVSRWGEWWDRQGTIWGPHDPQILPGRIWGQHLQKRSCNNTGGTSWPFKSPWEGQALTMQRCDYKQNFGVLPGHSGMICKLGYICHYLQKSIFVQRCNVAISKDLQTKAFHKSIFPSIPEISRWNLIAWESWTGGSEWQTPLRWFLGNSHKKLRIVKIVFFQQLDLRNLWIM